MGAWFTYCWTAEPRRLREIADGMKLLPAAVDVVLNTSDEIRKVAKESAKPTACYF